MKILAVETSTLTGGVALLEDDRLKGEVTLSVSVQHSERLMPAIDQLLKDAGETLQMIDLFAVSAGPGSFTGLRVGIAAVQGLSFATGKRVVPVSTLKALAINAVLFRGTVVPVLDARRGEFYAAAYRSGGVPGTLPEPLMDEQAVSLESLLDQVGKLPRPFLFLGEGALAVRETLAEWAGEGGIVAPPLLSQPRAASVGFLASLEGNTAMSLPLPRYLRAVS